VLPLIRFMPESLTYSVPLFRSEATLRPDPRLVPPFVWSTIYYYKRLRVPVLPCYTTRPNPIGAAAREELMREDPLLAALARPGQHGGDRAPTVALSL
jgi:hypothetical protein